MKIQRLVGRILSRLKNVPVERTSEIELETRYLVDLANLPDLTGYEYVDIEDRYVYLQPEISTMRLRKETDMKGEKRYLMTIKTRVSPDSASAFDETTELLSEQDYIASILSLGDAKMGLDYVEEALARGETGDLIAIYAPSVLSPIYKTRYKVPIADPSIQHTIDIFHGDLEGYCVAEFEFENSNVKAEFQVPAYCGPEITFVDKLAAGELIWQKYIKLQPMLDRLQNLKADREGSQPGTGIYRNPLH